MKLSIRNYLKYKFFNSLFSGLTLGSIFILYTPLEPSIFSLGGIILALGILLVAKVYNKILNIGYFFKINLLVETIMIFVVGVYLIYPLTYEIALAIYAGYQITFIFSWYLIRSETIFMKKPTLLSKLDMIKQKGYLVGLTISYLFYKTLEIGFFITDKSEQVYVLHYLFLLTQIIVIYKLILSFKKE